MTRVTMAEATTTGNYVKYTRRKMRNPAIDGGDAF
jgi:hypothetical protein